MSDEQAVPDIADLNEAADALEGLLDNFPNQHSAQQKAKIRRVIAWLDRVASGMEKAGK